MQRGPIRVRDFVNRSRLREVGLPMLLAAAVLLLSAMVLLGANISELRRTNTEVQRTNAALLDLAEINTLVMGIDMTVRGYALTDDPEFLVYETDNRARLHIAVDHFASLVKGEPEWAGRIAALRKLIAKHEALFLDLSALGPGHAREVGAAIADPVKRQARYDVQNTLTGMRTDELTQLSALQEKTEGQIRRTNYLAFGIFFLAFFAGLFGVVLTFYVGAPLQERQVWPGNSVP
jgi:CHASE3 domain sensor protein